MSVKYALGWDVWRWPEFEAFANRLGIPMEVGTRNITIDIPCDGVVSVTHEYLADDKKDNPSANSGHIPEYDVDVTTCSDTTESTLQASSNG